jgi:hypothetical protein
MHRDTTYYDQCGTRFFRLASRAFWADKRVGFNGYGGNRQNIEKSARVRYIPDDGKIFLQADQSGAEALIVAYLCRHALFRDLFLNGIKSHVFVALHVFKEQWKKKVMSLPGGIDTKPDIDALCNTPINKIKLNPSWKEVDALIKSSDNWSAAERYYYIGKQICHSSNYNIKAGRFTLNTLSKSKGKIVLTTRQSEGYLNFYHGMFPEIAEWHDRTVQQIVQTNYLFDLFGYPHYFFHKGEVNEGEFKEFFACVPQATVGLITRKAFTDLYNYIEKEKKNWDILQDNHDSYLVQCPVAEELECASKMTEFLNVPLVSTFDGSKFNMKSEVASGYNWSPYSEKKNPTGLREIKI